MPSNFHAHDSEPTEQAPSPQLTRPRCRADLTQDQMPEPNPSPHGHKDKCDEWDFDGNGVPF